MTPGSSPALNQPALFVTFPMKLPTDYLAALRYLLTPLFLTGCIAEDNIAEIDLLNGEDTRIVYLAFDTFAPTAATAVAAIAQSEFSNVLADEGIAPAESRRFERTCLINPQYLNLRWEDGTKRYYRIQTPCGKRIQYTLLQNQ